MSTDSKGSLFVEGAETFKIRQPKLVSVTYTAVYDTGMVQMGGVVHDGGDEPLTVSFQHARGASTPFTEVR